MTNHPFKIGTKLAQVFTILSDEKWHCGKHELPGTQPAKAIQIIRQHGFDIENLTIFCDVCNDKIVHRRLKSTLQLKESFIRQNFPQKLKKRVHSLYNNIEAISMRSDELNLEVDHRFPQVRWSKDESFDPDMSDKELRDRFQLLTRAHNLWKSRYCEHCVKTNQRGTFIGINYFYEGEATWSSEIPKDDPKGCEGCFWYNPEKWRNSLNSYIEQSHSEVGDEE